MRSIQEVYFLYKKHTLGPYAVRKGWRAFILLETSPARWLRVFRIYINVQDPQVAQINKNLQKILNPWSGPYLITTIENHDPRAIGFK